MSKLTLLMMLASYMAVALTEFRAPQRGLIHQIQKGMAGPNPYVFLTVPKGRSQALVQGFEVIEENVNGNKDAPNEEDFRTDEEDNNNDADITKDDNEDADEDNNEEDEEIKDSSDSRINEEDNDDDYDEFDNVMDFNLNLRRPTPQIKNAKPTHMMVSRKHAGAIMVPDQIIEIDAQSVIDEKTGKPALLLPRSFLDTIPDGSVVALLERSSSEEENDDDDEAEAEARANRVIVRRRRKGTRRTIKRRSSGNGLVRIIRLSSNRSPSSYRRQNVRVVRVGNGRGASKRRLNRRRVYL